MASKPKPKVNMVGAKLRGKLEVVVCVWQEPLPVPASAKDWRTPDVKRVKRKRPIALHGGRQYAFENLQEARDFAKEKGYTGIHVVLGGGK